MGLLSDRPVGLQWVQYRSSPPIYNGVIIRPASWSTMGTIQVWPVHLQWTVEINTFLASQSTMDLLPVGQSIKDGVLYMTSWSINNGKNSLTSQSSGGPCKMGDYQVSWWVYNGVIHRRGWHFSPCSVYSCCTSYPFSCLFLWFLVNQLNQSSWPIETCLHEILLFIQIFSAVGLLM
jgi:hypothetical protein